MTWYYSTLLQISFLHNVTYMEWCHQIPFINAAIIYWRRSCVIVKILQHRDFVSMCLPILTHIPQDVSAIIEVFQLVKYGESWKKVFSKFDVFCNAFCNEMYTCLPGSCFHVSQYVPIKNKRCK